MDAYAQRLQERARMRKEKLDKLNYQNIESVSKPPLSEVNGEEKNEKKTLRETYFESTGHENVEPNISTSCKNQLRRLGALYSDDQQPNLSSPIHRTEDKFLNNEDMGGNTKCKLRSNKLAALASTINEWEDDLSHPKSLTDAKKTKNVALKQEKGREMKVNDSLMGILESQGFKRSKSNSKLTYAFNNQKLKSPSPKTQSPKKNTVMSPSKSPKRAGIMSPGKSPNRNMIMSPSKSPRMGMSALKPLEVRNVSNSKLNTSVMQKAAIFEASGVFSPPKTDKDPAELSLSERKALFERNKCPALLPKVGFSTPLPAKFINESGHKSVPQKTSREVCEKSSSDNVASKAILERQKELEFLRNRWNKNKEMTARGNNVVNKEDDDLEKLRACWNDTKSTKSVESRPTVTSSAAVSPPPPPPLPLPISLPTSPKTPVYQDSPETMKVLQNVKKISVVSPPDSGRLYPSLDDIKLESESTDTSSAVSTPAKNESMYLRMSFSDILEASKNNPCTPPRGQAANSSSPDIDFDNLIDDALGDVCRDEDDEEEEEELTPPKQRKLGADLASDSFSYQYGTPLMQTVSFYRKQQQSGVNSPADPVRSVNRDDVKEVEDVQVVAVDEKLSVDNKITKLYEEVSKQQIIISQASQALNLCLATVEFSNSFEQVQGERLLLLAGHKRQACLHEIERLKIERSLRPRGSNPELSERGDVTVTDINLPLKRETLRNMAAEENVHYFVCLVMCEEQVLASPVVPATRDNLNGVVLKFPGRLTLNNLYSDFTVKVEVYNLQLSKEVLPHNIKYHIKDGGVSNKKRTPLKLKKGESSKLLMPVIQSPAGPCSVRSSSFQLAGYVVFSLREVSHTQWTLSKVPYISPLEGTIQMRVESELKLDTEYRGFLTMFDDISGLGAWHRRWCLLSSHTLSYWKYPDDETRKVPLGSIDLRTVVTESVGVVSRDICARLHTFLLETTRPSSPDDRDSLIMYKNGDVTIIRHLLSADTKEERIEWCSKLNKSLTLLRAWSGANKK